MKQEHQSRTKLKEDVLFERLALIERELEAPESTKIKQLIHKLVSGEQHFLFSGHFSAGKSSLINAIFETNLLPSSPIPASANTVRVRSGHPEAAVYFQNGKKMVFKAPYDMEEIKTYCLNGDDVERVELSAPSILEEDVVLVDTPGIDSTDEAHRLSTESSMYLADVVFYVMDYNHVQSEVNYQFIRELYRQNKKVILIVNQIDKHKESELSFKSFQRSVVESFETWGMSLESFFFISLRESDHPHNQFKQLKTYMEGLSKKTSEEKVGRVYDSAVELLSDVTTVSSDDEVSEVYEALEKTMSFSKERFQLIEEEFQSETANILKSAILMPYDVREAGRAYLESLQPGFKVGLVFREKKTDQERAARYNRFVSGLEEQVKSQLEWHFQQLLQQLVNTSRLKKKEMVIDDQLVADFSVIQDEAQKGNGATGEAVLHYTENISNKLKVQLRQQAERVKDELLEQVKADHERIVSDVNASFKKEVGEEAATSFLKRIEEADDQYEGLWSILEGRFDNDATRIGEELRRDLSNESREVVIVESNGEKTVPKTSEKKKKQQSTQQVKAEALPSPDRTVRALNDAAEQISDLPGFEYTYENLIERAKKMAEKNYTVALFGAFSAGKSSFANALIGERILPSSPNPTTATLNRICPVNEQHQHKTAMIFYKSEDELLDDLNHSFSYFGEKAFTLKDSLQIIKAGKLFKRESADTKPHALFLRAVLEGKDVMAYLGKQREVSMDQYEDMVVNETKAAFISSISLYYDCPLTQEGITLVDTPGADSINARHTGVAFQYMKSADAILYVTYYNHAFSKADREFLIQLGRVKDVFELDKMFFLLNAADLASDEAELQIVLDHVTNQLQQYGIRYPALYPVSSLAGILDAKQPNEKDRQFLSRLPDRLKDKGGLDAFESRFYQFIQSDLSYMAVEANISEISRVAKLLEQWLSHFEMNVDQKEKELQQIQRYAENVNVSITEYSITESIGFIKQELTELVHYIPQRLFYRFNDFFKEAFNPSVVKGREGLTNASHNLIEDIDQDLLQEMRAASLRVERFMKRERQKNEKDLQLLISEKLADFRFSRLDDQVMETPEFTQTLASFISVEVVQKLARTEFKSPKQFFEQGGRDSLRDELKETFQSPVQNYLHAERETIEAHAVPFYEQLVKETKLEIKNQVNAYVDARSRMLTSTVTKKVLEEKSENLAQIKSIVVEE